VLAQADIGKRKQPRKETRYNLTNKEELIRWYGMHMLMESTYGNETTSLRKHHKSIKERFGDNKIGLLKLKIETF
jgi:hypothetical protein